jgi:hypothetical protein
VPTVTERRGNRRRLALDSRFDEAIRTGYVAMGGLTSVGVSAHRENRRQEPRISVSLQVLETHSPLQGKIGSVVNGESHLAS